MNELKNLQASGLTTLGQALRSSFDLLNLNRLVSGIDNYGQVTNLFIVFCFLYFSVFFEIIVGKGFWWFEFGFPFYYFLKMLDSCVPQVLIQSELFSFLLHLLNIPWNILALFSFLSYKASSNISDPNCRHTIAVCGSMYTG